MRADLHTHSVYSDGKYGPEELAAIARGNGVELFSVTDHDNFAGDAEKRRAAEGAGMRYVTGVEISAYEGRKKVHVTGYAYDASGELCARYQRERVRAADERLEDVIGKLKFYKGIALTKEEVYAQRKVEGIPIHTNHIVYALLAKGCYPDIGSVFKDCFRPELPTYSFVGRPTPDDAIRMLHSMGGIACIAHPGRIDLPPDERERLIRDLRRRGMDGLECTYSTHTAKETAYFKALAGELGMYRTGGSDFHREGSGRFVGKPDFEPEEALLERLGIRA